MCSRYAVRRRKRNWLSLFPLLLYSLLSFFLDFIFHLVHLPTFLFFATFFLPRFLVAFSSRTVFFYLFSLSLSPSLPPSFSLLRLFFHLLFLSVIHMFLFFTSAFFSLSSTLFLCSSSTSPARRSFPLYLFLFLSRSSRLVFSVSFYTRTRVPGTCVASPRRSPDPPSPFPCRPVFCGCSFASFLFHPLFSSFFPLLFPSFDRFIHLASPFPPPSHCYAVDTHAFDISWACIPGT